VCVGVVVAAGLACSATAWAHTPQGFAASYKTACCYKILASGSADLRQNYGTDPSNGVIGTEEFFSTWTETTLVEYVEAAGAPDLEPAETPSGHFAPVSYEKSEWVDEADENNQISGPGPYPLTPCKQTYSGKPRLAYNTSFYDIDLVRQSGYPNVRKAFKGHRYVLQVAGGDTPGIAPCGEYGEIAVGLEPPPGPNNSEDQASQPFGPFNYYVTLPPRNDLRHAKDAGNEFETSYDHTLNFTACLDHAPTMCSAEGGYGMHTTAEATHFFLKFAWFPSSELQRQIDDLKNQK
jgi:hypothetical protein